MPEKSLWKPMTLAMLLAAAVMMGAACLMHPNPGIMAFQHQPMLTSSIPAQCMTSEVQIAPIPASEPLEIESVPQPSGITQPATESAGLGVLTIGNKRIPIGFDVEESTLSENPGWMPGSALPGESGMCVILGHRNRKHLRPLEKVEIGDTISFVYPDGRSAAYTITEITTYENTEDWRLPATAGDTLVLVTCWPFRYSGPAPGKMVVMGVREGRM